MKKLGLFVLICAIALALCACSGSSGQSSTQSSSQSSSGLADSKYVGTWKVDTISLKDVSEEFDTEWIIVLEADGTGKSMSEDESDDFTWEPTSNGFKTKGDIKLEFTDDGDGIKTKIIGAELHFNKVE